MVASADGSMRYTIFDKCAVRIAVEETVGRRRQLVLTLVGREQIAEADRVG